MLKIFGEYYYVDFDAIIEMCLIDKYEENGKKQITLNSFKYDIIKSTIDRIYDGDDEIDEENVHYGKNETLSSYRLAFNSLIASNILKKIEE